jgi:hypothetical protein
MRNTIDNSQDVIDSRDLIARIEELREQRTPYVIGWNMPGYMPDNEPTRYADADDARESLADEMDRAADELADSIVAGHTELTPDDELALRDAAAELREMSGDESDAEFGATIAGFHYWITFDSSDTAGLNDDDAAELQALESFAEELRDYGDFEHGEALIRDSYFEDYARELAEDIGAIDPRASWPLNCIDWEQAASELKTDYTCAEFDGITYWMRA